MARGDRADGQNNSRQAPRVSRDESRPETTPEGWGTPPPYPGDSGTPGGSPTPPARRIPRLRVFSGDTSSGGVYLSRPKFNLRTFGKDDASYSLEEFLSTMDNYVDSFDVCPQEAVASVKSYLAGQAAAIVYDADVSTWEEIKDVLWRHYVPEGYDRSQQSALVYMKRDPIMINCFLQAWGDKDVEKTVLANNVRSYDEVVRLAERMMLVGGPPSMTSATQKKPSVFHCRERGDADEISEGTEARLRNIVTRKVDEALRDRGRSRDRRQTSYVQNVVTQMEPSPTQGSRESPRTRTPSANRSKGASRDPSKSRTRSVSHMSREGTHHRRLPQY